MSKWYIYEDETATNIIDSKLILLEEINGIVYERFVTNGNNESWKVKGDLQFHMGYDIERFKRFIERYETHVKEISEEEAFVILL